MDTPWDPEFDLELPTKLTLASRPASTHHDQALRPLLRKSPEFQDPPSSRHSQKPRSSSSSTRR
ncbi:hypothetical protein F2Q69_00029504 [Brassica cretica]|uniref:Uncharacterized protein n=1 Tax=Brassica cretica TaxID=69181 RepID=A0A8S9RYJ1_BRACR|nr:hypothetical protein F2Q69_00029504 [Brassica cretica]